MNSRKKPQPLWKKRLQVNDRTDTRNAAYEAITHQDQDDMERAQQREDWIEAQELMAEALVCQMDEELNSNGFLIPQLNP